MFPIRRLVVIVLFSVMIWLLLFLAIDLLQRNLARHDSGSVPSRFAYGNLLPWGTAGKTTPNSRDATAR
jgi:hypothetical protein